MRKANTPISWTTSAVRAYGILVAILGIVMGLLLGELIGKNHDQSPLDDQGEVVIRFQSSFEDTKELVDRLANAMVVFEADMLELEWRRDGETYSHVRLKEGVKE